MRAILRTSLTLLCLSSAALGAVGLVACANALHLDPPGPGTGTGGHTGDGGASCRSNPDCSYPTPICDTAAATCVQCLVLSDCAGTPGSVCSQGTCQCPSADDPSMIGPCPSTVWKPMSTVNAPEARSHHVAVWTGSQMVVWGGMNGGADPLNSGGRYDPVKNAWAPTAAPSGLDGRYDATAVWDDADKLMLVWGGIGAGGAFLNDGWRYDPAGDKWTPMAALDGGGDAGTDGGTTFVGRAHHTAVWATGLTGLGTTTAGMIVFGGQIDSTGSLAADGQVYDPATNQWVLPIAQGGSGPNARAYHSAVWSSNNLMVVFGGFTSPSVDGNAYNLTPSPPNGNWNTFTGTGAPPTARQKHTGIWDPVTMTMIVWGGMDAATTYFQDGAALGTSNTWSPLGGSGPMPEGRVDHSSVILAGPKGGSQLVIFGGDNASGILDKGWTLDTSATGVWSPLPTPGPSPRKNHTAVATSASSTAPGSSMILWGGETSSGVFTNDGWIYTVP